MTVEQVLSEIAGRMQSECADSQARVARLQTIIAEQAEIEQKHRAQMRKINAYIASLKVRSK